ncbi:MAG: hypothetical protein QOD30_1617 [Actinomycetota bacterium]|nr:hypothetical protein [Actinomycetota bacterium]
MTVRQRILIVEGGSQRGALAATRALGRAGHEVTIASGERAYAPRSRWATRWVPINIVESGRMVDDVERCVRQHRCDVVFAGDDESLLTLSRHRDRLGDARFPYVAHDHVLRAVDKLSLHEAGRAAGIATPETTLEEPLDRRDWIVKERLYLLGTLHDHPLADEVETRRSGRLVYQRVVDGDLHSVIVFVDADGTPCILSVQRAEALYPELFGISCRSAVISSAVLEDATRALFAVLQWRGLAQLQFVMEAGGAPYLIDFNGRFFGSLALTEAHVPACDAWVDLAMGRPAPALGRVPTGARYQWLEGDLRRALSTSQRTSSLRDALMSSRGETHSLFAVADPKPAAGVIGDMARRALGRLRG